MTTLELGGHYARQCGTLCVLVDRLLCRSESILVQGPSALQMRYLADDIRRVHARLAKLRDDDEELNRDTVTACEREMK